MLCAQRQQHYIRTRKAGSRFVHGISRVRHQRHVAGLKIRHAQVKQSFLRTNQCLNLILRINRNAKAPAVICSHRLPELWQAASRHITMRARLVNGMLERIANECRGRLVWRTHVKANYIPAGRLQRDHALCQLGKKVRLHRLHAGCKFHFLPLLMGSACALHSSVSIAIVPSEFYGAAVVVAVTVGSGVLLATKPSGVMDGVGLGPSSPRSLGE